MAVGFPILLTAVLPFHLPALEATLIETLNPAICRQTQLVNSLKIIR